VLTDNDYAGSRIALEGQGFPAVFYLADKFKNPEEKNYD
jgi:hypothetical protein